MLLSMKSAKISYFAAEMKHIKPAFSIQAPKIDFNSAQLIVEAGLQGFSMLVVDDENFIKALVVYNFKPNQSRDSLATAYTDIFKSENLLQKKYSKSHVFWSFPESIIVPAELLDTENHGEMISLVYGDALKGITRSDFLYKHNLHNVYGIPEQVIASFATHLPIATQTHLFSALANVDIAPGNHVYAVLYHNYICIMLTKQGKLQVIQFFNYSTPHDCVFHLLNTCRGFEVNSHTVHLHINGMIDEQSELYAAIHKYFLDISFDGLPDGYNYHETIKSYPHHFFSHLFKLVACV